MNKTIMLSALVAAISLVSVGCGGGDTKTVAKKKIIKPTPISNTPQAHVGDIKRVVKHEFELPTGEDVIKKDNKEGIVLLKDISNYYISINHKNAAKNVQFLIDTDNDSRTGNPKEGGAEILVENGQLYTYNEANETAWIKYIENPTYSAYNAGEKKDTIKLSENLILSPNFSVKAEVLNEDWQPIIISPSKYSKTYYRADISNDLYASDYIYLHSSENNSSVKLINYDNYVDMVVSSNTFTHYMSIYIDSDLKDTTGFRPTLDDNTSVWANMGADYFIEDAKLYSYDASLKDWPWRYEVDLPYSIIDTPTQKSISFHIKRLELNNPSTGLKIGIMTNDRNWNNTQGIPDINSSTEIRTYGF